VRPSAASSNSGHAASRPASGALQRKSEYHAITVQTGNNIRNPEGFTMLRSRIRAHNNVSARMGSVTSHSRSQSDLASSPAPTVINNEPNHNTASRKAVPTSSSGLNSTVRQNDSGGSSAACRLRSAPRISEPNPNIIMGQTR
jgi:hypothetical protein